MFPKHIHQIWFDFNKGIEIDEERMVLMDMNKMNALKTKHKYELWTLSMAIEFVEKYYPYYLSFLKKKWKYDIIKCDFFRYLLMYHFGGLYVDLDFVLTDNFMSMYENQSDNEIVLFEEWYDSVNLKQITSSQGSLHNGFLLSKLKNEFWLKMLNQVITTAPMIQTKDDVWKMSGTNLLRNMYISLQDLSIYHCPYYYVCSFQCVGHDGRVIQCTNKDSPPLPLSESSWKFYSLGEYIEENNKTNSSVFKDCYAVCIGVKKGSLWVNY